MVDMSSTSFSKSKAFKEREESAREKLRQIVKQDLIADLSRLFGDTTFSDVFFIVKNVEFQAHTVVLRARAPNFSRLFLPSRTSPLSVQTCIQINGLEAAEFEAFLRSAYTDDDFKDYDESSYPWNKQTVADSSCINHVISDNELTDKSSRFPEDLNGMCTKTHDITQSDCINDDHDCVTTSLDPSAQNFDKQDGVTCTKSDCTADMSNNEKIFGNNVALEDDKNSTQLQNNDQEFELLKPSQCVSSCVCASNIQPAVQGSNCPATLDNNAQDTSSSVVASSSLVDHTSQHDTDFVDGCQNVTEYACQQSQKSTSHCNNKAEGERMREGTTSEQTLAHCESTGNNFKTKQGHLDHTENGTASNEFKTLESELEVLGCSCNLGQDLLHLLYSEVGSDVTFLVNGGKVKAHKAILCARSNYFSAMLHGDWIEGKTNEIPLVGVNYNGLMTVLKYIYGGTAQVKNDLAVICDTLPLVDMYGLEGLREVITCTLKIEKCHLFHKPCSECITGVFECLEVSELFSLTELKKSCVKWIAKHFDRVLGTKGFTTLPKHLQEEVLAEIQHSFAISSAIEVLNNCDRLASCTPLVKWTEPVHAAVSSIQESCLLFIASNFFSLVDETSFHEILKGVGWSIPVLEKIISAVKKNLVIENCCDQLRAILRLKRIIILRATEESQECYPEEVTDLVANLHNHCVKFIRSNLFKVTRSEGWKRLKLTTQREIKEGAVFGSLGDAGDRPGAVKGRSGPNSVPPSSRSPTRNASQRLGTDSRARGLGRGSAATEAPFARGSNQQRPTSARGYQRRATGLAPINKRPCSGRPGSAQNSTMSGRGKTSSAPKVAPEKRPPSSQTSAATGSSRMSSSFLRNSWDKPPSSAKVPGRAKISSSKTSSNANSAQRADKTPSVMESNFKKGALTSQETSNSRPSSTAGSSALKKRQIASGYSLPTGGTNMSFSKSSSREKALSAGGSRVQTKQAPTRTKVQSFQCRKEVTRESRTALASCKSNESLVSNENKDSNSRKVLSEDETTTQGSKDADQGFASQGEEKNLSNENSSSSSRAVDEAFTGVPQSSGGTQATSASSEDIAVSMSAENSERNSLTLNEGANTLRPDLRRNDYSGTPNDDQFDDSLELD